MKANFFFKGLAAIALLGLPILAFAQDYEDDIYFNPSKSTKSKTKTSNVTSTRNTLSSDYVSQQTYEAAGTYSFNTGNTRDVDEYNRHGAAYAYTDSLSSANDSTAVDEFGYTRRIERFHNPNVVVNSGDADLIDYYYSTDASASDCVTNINVYVVDDPFYYSSWRYPYYGWSRWNRWCYSPWYWDTYYGWGGLGWGGFYDPYFSWGWGGFGFGWGGWNWGWNWAFAGPSHWHGGGHGWQNITPGAGRAHAPGNIGGTMNSARRASYSGNHNTGSNWSRPGNMGRAGSSIGSALASPSRTNSSNGAIGTTTGRGRNNSSSSSNNNSSSRRNSSSYNNNNNYNSNSSSSSRGSGSSWGGSRGGGSGMSGGGHSGGGGGGGRGRR